MDQSSELPPIRSPNPPSPEDQRCARRGSMGSSSMQLPSLHEILGDIPRTDPHEDRNARPYQPNATQREPHHLRSIPDAQTLAPPLGRQPYRPSPAYPPESTTSSEPSDRRSSYASPASSNSLASGNGSPVLHPLHSAPNSHRPPLQDYRTSGGLPPLYGNGDLSIHPRGAPSPAHHQPYHGPYNGYPPPEYMGPYRMAPAQVAVTPNGSYPMTFEGMDYGDGKQKRRRGNLPKAVTDILRQWFQDHIAHPYPTEEEKQALMVQTGLTMSQISNWFINARRRSLPQMTRVPQADADMGLVRRD